jgi:hypothetical protein
MFVLTDHSAVSVDFCDVSIDFEVLLTFLMFLLTLKTIPLFLIDFEDYSAISIDFSDVFIDFEDYSDVSVDFSDVSIDFEDYSAISNSLFRCFY